MKKSEKNTPEILLRVIEILLAALAVAVLVLSLYNVRSASSGSGADRLEESVRRAVMSCYASEGVYPESLQYLKDHYGLQIDENRYAVQYSVFAENLMPDITVVKKGA